MEHAECAVCLIGAEEWECTPKQNSRQDQMPGDQVVQMSTAGRQCRAGNSQDSCSGLWCLVPGCAGGVGWRKEVKPKDRDIHQWCSSSTRQSFAVREGNTCFLSSMKEHTGSQRVAISTKSFSKPWTVIIQWCHTHKGSLFLCFQNFDREAWTTDLLKYSHSVFTERYISFIRCFISYVFSLYYWCQWNKIDQSWM